MLLKKLSVMALCFVSLAAFGIEKEHVSFEDVTTVGTTKLSLNGVCLRKVYRFGIPIKVYVAGLYLPKKASKAEEILKGSNPKYLRLVFVRNVDGSTLEDAWKEAFGKNCDQDCDKAKDGLKQFNKMMSDVRQGSKIEVTIQDKSLDVNAGGRQPKSGKIDNEAFARNFLKIFIGKEPPTEDCKNEFLGIEKK